MRRLLRWAFNLAASLSALLFVAMCAVWERSHHACYVLSRESRLVEPRHRESDSVCVSAGAGAFVLSRERRAATAPPDWEPDETQNTSIPFGGVGNLSWSIQVRDEPRMDGNTTDGMILCMLTQWR